jgi:uncharacterized protein YkwD
MVSMRCLSSICFTPLTVVSLCILSACAAGSGDDVATTGVGGSVGTASTGTGSTPITAFPLPAQTYSHGEPSNLEQQLLELTQALRADPADVGAAMVNLPSVQDAIVQYMVDKAKVVSDFKGYSPVAPLAFDPRLLASSKVHSIDMATNGFQEHDGTDGKHFYDRITAAGYSYSYCAENIFSYADSPEECNAAFGIDWGNPDLGHRLALLDIDGAKRDIGISIVENPPSTKVGPEVVTEDFGEPLTDKHRYLVGVAYNDQNGNGAYDPGEGLAGMNIVPDQGDTYAVTSMSGGYAIPFNPMVGPFHVQIQDSTGKALQQKDTELAADNVKVDFVIQ